MKTLLFIAVVLFLIVVFLGNIIRFLDVLIKAKHQKLREDSFLGTNIDPELLEISANMPEYLKTPQGYSFVANKVKGNPELMEMLDNMVKYIEPSYLQKRTSVNQSSTNNK